MFQIKPILALMNCVAFIRCQMEPFVVGGITADITQFPHSVYIFIKCFEPDYQGARFWICGGSIVNQRVVLTAAHCLYGCSPESTFTLYTGHIRRRKGQSSKAESYFAHENYNVAEVSSDIALVLLKTDLKFGTNIKRIALMKNPPYFDDAQVAGWGVIDVDSTKLAKDLQYVDQFVWEIESCKRVIHSLPQGTICASSGNEDSYSSGGDSGSALMVRGYIQIGLVSYKIPSISKDLIIYTDTGFFYDWIEKFSMQLYCSNFWVSYLKR